MSTHENSPNPSKTMPELSFAERRTIEAIMRRDEIREGFQTATGEALQALGDEYYDLKRDRPDIFAPEFAPEEIPATKEAPKSPNRFAVMLVKLLYGYQPRQ